ncbi:hypothetical protein FLAN108750_14015 [Flavobacterium antarcticum]
MKETKKVLEFKAKTNESNSAIIKIAYDFFGLSELQVEIIENS